MNFSFTPSILMLEKMVIKTHVIRATPCEQSGVSSLSGETDMAGSSSC